MYHFPRASEPQLIEGKKKRERKKKCRWEHLQLNEKNLSNAKVLIQTKRWYKLSHLRIVTFFRMILLFNLNWSNFFHVIREFFWFWKGVGKPNWDGKIFSRHFFVNELKKSSGRLDWFKLATFFPTRHLYFVPHHLVDIHVGNLQICNICRKFYFDWIRPALKENTKEVLFSTFLHIFVRINTKTSLTKIEDQLAATWNTSIGSRVQYGSRISSQTSRTVSSWTESHRQVHDGDGLL